MEQPVGAAGQAIAMGFNNWVAGRLKERANIQKQAQLYKEEFGGKRSSYEDADGRGPKGGRGRGRGTRKGQSR